jgi:4-hydroxy-2-oxoheptanedioate aldolase
MKKNRVKELWREGKPAVMGWCSSGNPYIAEVMAHAGYDALTIDWQHGVGVSQSSIVSCIQAIGNTSTVPLVRVPKNEPDYISYVLDAGAYGVIVPMVNSPEEAAAAGLACRYAPQGNRSIGGSRAALATGMDDYVKHANDEILCLAMIETVSALDSVEEIAKAPGIDGLYVGPSDLSLDMGVSLSGWATDEEHLAACRRIVEAARKAGVVPCHHGAGPEVSAMLMKMGFMLCQITSDVRTVAAVTASNLKAFAAAMEENGVSFR